MAQPVSPTTIDYRTLEEALSATTGDAELFKTIVNAPFDTNRVGINFLFLGIIVLLLANKQTKTIDRIALSKTELAKNTTDVSAKKFEEIKIPLGYEGNIIAQAIATGKPQETTDWQNLFAPELTPEQARINQASGGIAYSAIYPLKAREGGALIFSYFQYEQAIDSPQHQFMGQYSQLVSQFLTTMA